MKARVACFLVAGAVFTASTAMAPQNIPSTGSAGAAKLDSITDATARSVPDPGRALNSLEARDSTAVAEYLNMRRALYRYQVMSYDYTMEVFKWQQVSSKWIFWIVVAMVVTGLVFSGLQFRADMQRRDLEYRLSTDAQRVTEQRAAAPVAGDAERATAPGDAQEGRHHLKLGTAGVEVSSSVLGVVILTLSLGFFYLYLQFVYPISVAK